MGEHTGLAGSRAGVDRERPGAARDRGALGVVETREEIGHRCTVPKGYDSNGDDAANDRLDAAENETEKEAVNEAKNEAKNEEGPE